MRHPELITEVDQFVIDFVRQLRNDKNLTQEDLGNIIHVSRSFIKDVESINRSSKYNIRHVNAIADYFGMSPKDFLPAKAFPVNPVTKEKRKTILPAKKTILKKVKKK